MAIDIAAWTIGDIYKILGGGAGPMTVWGVYAVVQKYKGKSNGNGAKPCKYHSDIITDQATTRQMVKDNDRHTRDTLERLEGKQDKTSAAVIKMGVILTELNDKIVKRTDSKQPISERRT